MGPGYKTLFSFSTHLSIKFIMLINVIMPTVVGVLTFISMINASSESMNMKAGKVLIVHLLNSFNDTWLKFHAQQI